MSTLKLEHILNCHPIVKTDITMGEDTYYFDSSGKKFIDFESGVWCTALGHNNPRIKKTMINQIDKVIHLHHKLTSYAAEVLAVNLLQLFHFTDGKAVFLNSGSEAVEMSIRLSRLISTPGKTLTFSNSYLSALSSNSLFRDKEHWCDMNFLQCRNCPRTECTSECSILSHIDFSHISAFILESASCGGVFFPPYKLVKLLVDEVKRHGGIIVVNEVTTGFGRTGRWFGYSHYDVEPDIVALGKSLGNGYPISAVVMSNSIANQVEAKNFVYAQSHQNDPLGCTVANEVINIFKEDNMIECAHHLGEFFMKLLLELKGTCPSIKDVRGRGLMLAVELNVEKSSEQIAEKMLEEGYFIDSIPQLNILRFFPALTMTKVDITSMCTVLKVNCE